VFHSPRPRVAIIGLGGYAARHHEAVLALEKLEECRLVCTCDPRPDSFRDQTVRWAFGARGIAVFGDYREMLERHVNELDVVIIPTPIPLHEEMHAAVVGHGLTAYLEKPPSLDPQELERMIALDAQAAVPTLVGFNFIAEPARQALKRRLLAGEFGALRSATLLGLWARSSDYYGRNDWAGHLLSSDGRLLLDSCLGNGLSHHVHNLLHWAGLDGLDRWAEALRVRASLLRAHPIEGPDTVFLEAETSSGVPLRLALSHACRGPELHRERLVCELAEIDYMTQRRAEIRWRDGRIEPVTLDPFDAQMVNLRVLFSCILGKTTKPPTTLNDSGPFVRLHALAYISAREIKNWEEAVVIREPAGRPACHVEVVGIEAMAERFLVRREWPRGEPEPAAPDALGELPVVVREMVACAALASAGAG